MLRALLCGYYGKGNGGDEALLATLLQMLPASVQPWVLSGDPEKTAEQYGVEAYDRMAPLTVLKALRQSDALIWGGGSLMQDVTSATSPLYYGGLMATAQRLGLKTIAWAQGVGPLQRPLTRWLARQTFAGCQAVSVRDQASANLMSQWQISHRLAPDPVWALTASPYQPTTSSSAPRVVVALRPHPELTPARLETLILALKQFQDVTQTSIELVPFQPSRDQAIAALIHAQLPKTSHIVTVENPQTLKGVFKGVQFTIAMRYHGLIMAAAEGSRCFALSYDPKVSQLMQTLSLPGWELVDTPDDPGLICQEWINSYTKFDPLSTEHCQSLVQQALVHRDLLHQVLGA